MSQLQVMEAGRQLQKVSEVSSAMEFPSAQKTRQLQEFSELGRGPGGGPCINAANCMVFEAVYGAGLSLGKPAGILGST